MAKYFRKKTYGQSKTANCPFCGKVATQKSEQGVDVCRFHLKEKIPEIKCTCGSWLEFKVSKFGAYFNCVSCGNINYKKGLEIRKLTTPTFQDEMVEKVVKKEYSKPATRKKETTITSDDVEYFD